MKTDFSASWVFKANLWILFSGIAVVAWAQPSPTYTPGQIYQASSDPDLIGFSPMDPNGDGWITSSGGTFTSPLTEESSEFENQADWQVIWHLNGEPTNDLATGGACGSSEIVDNPNTSKHAAYYRLVDPDADPTNRNENLIIRMRIAQHTSGAFGYSILIDTDAKFGFTGDDADPNAVSGNPGFELEILYASGGGNVGVTVQDVDATDGPSSVLAHYDDGVRDQRSFALNSNCGGEPIFLDFYVDISTFPAGITAATPLRFVFASASSPASALGGSASDIGGVDDGDPAFSDDDAAFTTIVESTPQASFDGGYIACDTWYLDADGDGLGVLLSDSTSCTQPTGYVSDSTDNCDDTSANNYNDAANPACTYPTFTGLNDSLVVCDGADDLMLDLDTIHLHSGVTAYTLEEDFSSGYATTTLSGSVATFSFGGSGVGADTLRFKATAGASEYDIYVFVEEALYPKRTSSIKPLAASSPRADDGGLSISFEGTYDDNITVHFAGYPDQTLLNGVVQIPNDVFIITGYTNSKGCTNLEPATGSTPPGSPSPKRILVPCISCTNN